MPSDARHHPDPWEKSLIARPFPASSMTMQIHGHEIVIDSTFVALFCVGGWCFTLIFLSTTFTVNVYVPLSLLFGLPEMTPVVFLRWSPFGRLPDTDHL